MPEPYDNLIPKESREAMCVRFCDGLPDECIAIALANTFTVKKLWQQRDDAYIKMAENSIQILS